MCPPLAAATSDNRLWNCPVEQTIDKVLTNLLPAGFQDFYHVLNVSDATTVNKLLECPPGLYLGYSAANFLVPQFLADNDAETYCLSWTMSWHAILMTAKVITRQLPNAWQQTLIRNDITVIRTDDFSSRLN